MANAEEATGVRQGYVLLVCLVAAVGGLLFGYDTGVIAGAIGFLEGHFSLSAMGKGWAASCALVGCIFGALCAGTASDHLGRKKVLLGCAVLFSVSAIGSAIPRSLTEFVVARFIGGVGVGAASMLSPLYIAEIAPARIRGRLVSLNQLAIVLGFLVVYFVNLQISHQGDAAWNTATGWRWMFGSETLPALVFMVLLFVVPESPRWLVKQGREDTAFQVLARVNGHRRAEAEMVEIRETIAQEQGGIGQLLQPGLRLALLIGLVLAVMQQVTGINAILYYAPEIFKLTGENVDVSLRSTVYVGVVNVGFTLVGIWLVDRLGRKPLMLGGTAVMTLCLVLMGVFFWFEQRGAWLLAPILAYVAAFATSMGPVVWVILSEIFPTRIRGRAMSVATVALWCACYLVSQTFPWLLENAGSTLTFWIYAAMGLFTVVFVALVLPETKGRTLEEIEHDWLGIGAPQ